MRTVSCLVSLQTFIFTDLSSWALLQVRGVAPSWTHFPCGQWLAVDQGDGRIARTLIPRIIQVDHFDGMHDAAAQEMQAPLLDPLCANEWDDPQVPQKPGVTNGLETLESSGDSCRSTKLKAVRGIQKNANLQWQDGDAWVQGDISERPGKVDIMHRYLEGSYRAGM